MKFEEWWEKEERVYLNEYSTFKMVAAQAWKDAYEAGMDAGIKYILSVDAKTYNKMTLTADVGDNKDWNEVG